MSNETNAIQPGDEVRVLVAGFAYKSATPGIWVVNIDEDSDVYVNEDEMLPRDATAKNVKDADALAEFARWIVSLDDPDGPGYEARRAVTMGQIIGKAREALALPEE